MENLKVQISDRRKGMFQTYVHQRIKKNKNFMVAVTGATGSGKTYTALRLAELWDKDFTSNNIVFTPKEFLKLLNSGTLKQGSVIVADEFGVSMNSRNWQSASNQVINYILQTFRSKNYVVIFTSPDFAFIDSSARKLFHCHMMTQGINFKEKLCTIKPYMLQINQRTGDIFYKYLIPVIKGEGEKKISELYVSLPSKQIIKEYEIKKETFVNELNKELELKLFEKDNKDEMEKDKQDDKFKLMSAIKFDKEQGSTWKELAIKYNYSSANALRMVISRTNAQE